MMKKYLMTGMAAIAFCAAMTSCSSNDAFDPEWQSKQVTNNYEQAFIKTFGQPAANQDWGFGAAAGTRAINVNGNQWEEIPECTAAEAAAVFAYVNKVKSEVEHYTEVFPRNITDYFVTQVYTGTDTYSTADGTGTGILGSAHMDHLQIAMDNTGKLSDGTYGSLLGNWTHINNFNAGDNRNHGGNTLVNDGGTFDFAYNCSEDSKYHNKWIAIDGQYITDADGVNHAGKYYICFDFLAVNPDANTALRWKIPGNNPGEWVEKDGTIYGAAYNTIEEAIAAGATVTIEDWVWNSETGEPEKVYTTYTVGQEGTTDWSIDNVQGGNKIINADDVYTDWIVRIVEAQPADDNGDDDKKTSDYDICIIAEDLSATEASDFDFNDVVFEVKFDETGDGGTVKLRAAGGTLALTVAGHEVHAEFGFTGTYENGSYPMINTGAGASAAEKTFHIDNADKANRGKGIAIMVNKGTNEEPNWVPLEAKRGVPAAKIGVKPGFDYCSERQSIEKKYPKFAQWVQDVDVVWY